MPHKQIAPRKNPSSTLIFAFKPRQVLLAEHQKQNDNRHSSRKPSSSMAEKKLRCKFSKPEQRTQLLHSVLRFLKANDFSKSLKRLLKEAEIQGDSWEVSALELEDIYCKYLETCSDIDEKPDNHKQQGQEDKAIEKHVDSAGDLEIVDKKKSKKKNRDKDGSNVDAPSEKVDLKESKLDKKVPDTLENLEDMGKSSNKQKEKKKKKGSKLESDSLDGNGKQSDVKSGLAEEEPKTSLPEGTVKTKEKKKKNKSNTDNTDKSVLSDISMEEPKVETKEKKRKKEGKEIIALENGATEDKDSKKRKRSASGENKSQIVEESGVEESKRRKTEVREEATSIGQQESMKKVPEGKADGHNAEENGKTNNIELQQSSLNNVDDGTNGNLKKNGIEKSGQRKQLNGSTEPKTVNAFQRVKIDEVEFVDERLQDNSYWAKDGAENGYGAKAQEILGQVKGRDFRHEKTKKKRGSYRGGQIDLHSHSIKFNYSDEE